MTATPAGFKTRATDEEAAIFTAIAKHLGLSGRTDTIVRFQALQFSQPNANPSNWTDAIWVGDRWMVRR